jgi:hypothetical protein
MSLQDFLTAHGAAAHPIFKTPEPLASWKPITYGEVMKYVEEERAAELETKGKSQKRVGNFRTAMNGWLREFGLTEESPVGHEFSSDFRESLKRYLRGLADEGKSKQTLADRRSMMKVYREGWLSILQEATTGVLEGDFSQALNQLIESSGLPVAAIARNVAVYDQTLNVWRTGRSWPHKRSLPAVHRLEEMWGLPFGVLAAKLPKVALGEAGRARTGLTGYRKHSGVMRNLQYRLKEFPPILQGEWDDLFRFYTDAAWLRAHGLKRNSKWRIREHDNSCPAAELFRGRLSAFMGFLALPADAEDPHLRGKGLLPEELTLALLSDSDLVYSFLQFKRERTYLKQYNTATYTFLSSCTSLLHPETGFLWQLPEFGAKLAVPVPAADWREWCERHRSVIASIQKDLARENEFKKTRDPFEPIRSIVINNQHPLDVLFEMADAYEADAPPSHASSHRQAIHYQNLFLIKFTTLIPLRVFNLSVLTWKQDGTGNLYQKPDGSWWVRIDSSYLKNHKGAAKERPFDVPLHPSLHPYVETFLFTHRPHLLGANACDYVFRPGRTWKANMIRNDSQPVPTYALSRQAFTITQRYIPHCPGFGLHAFRHLVATEYIKNNPAGYAIAAAILYDKEETVRKNYAWVMPADKFGFWNDYVSTLLNKSEEADHD